MFAALLSEDGLTTVEYALLLAIICAAAYLGAWAGFGSRIADMTNHGANVLNSAVEQSSN